MEVIKSRIIFVLAILQPVSVNATSTHFVIRLNEGRLTFVKVVKPSTCEQTTNTKKPNVSGITQMQPPNTSSKNDMYDFTTMEKQLQECLVLIRDDIGIFGAMVDQVKLVVSEPKSSESGIDPQVITYLEAITEIMYHMLYKLHKRSSKNINSLEYIRVYRVQANLVGKIKALIRIEEGRNMIIRYIGIVFDGLKAAANLSMRILNGQAQKNGDKLCKKSIDLKLTNESSRNEKDLAEYVKELQAFKLQHGDFNMLVEGEQEAKRIN